MPPKNNPRIGKHDPEIILNKPPTIINVLSQLFAYRNYIRKKRRKIDIRKLYIVKMRKCI